MLSSQERVRDWRPTWRLNNTDPIASNFYPLTAAIEIQEADVSALAVHTDRAQGGLPTPFTDSADGVSKGGTLLDSGKVELMLHLRLLYDEQCGVASSSNAEIYFYNFIVLSAGGASLQSGQMELMLHRRLLYDDRRGVAEPLNETACGCRACHCDGLIVRGTHLLTLEVGRRVTQPDLHRRMI